GAPGGSGGEITTAQGGRPPKNKNGAPSPHRPPIILKPGASPRGPAVQNVFEAVPRPPRGPAAHGEAGGERGQRAAAAGGRGRGGEGWGWCGWTSWVGTGSGARMAAERCRVVPPAVGVRACWPPLGASVCKPRGPGNHSYHLASTPGTLGYLCAFSPARLRE